MKNLYDGRIAVCKKWSNWERADEMKWKAAHITHTSHGFIGEVSRIASDR
jgi:hypothetical protein